MLDLGRVIGNNVRQLRRELGQKQHQVAHALKMSTQMISAIENGTLPSMDVAVRLAQYFQVPVSRLVGDLEPEGDDYESMPTDAIQIHVLKLFHDLAFMPNETRNHMADWLTELGSKFRTPAAPQAQEVHTPPPHHNEQKLPVRPPVDHEP